MGEFRQNLDAILQKENSDQKGDVKKKSEIITPYASTFREEAKIVIKTLELKCQIYKMRLNKLEKYKNARKEPPLRETALMQATALLPGKILLIESPPSRKPN